MSESTEDNMRLHIRHQIDYRYGEDVFLEPHIIRLCPRQDGAQVLIDRTLRIAPEPAGVSDYLDAEGHVATEAWFTGTHGNLQINSTCVVETVRQNPFGFLLDPDRTALPFDYSDHDRQLLQPYLGRVVTGGNGDAVRNFALDLSSQVEGQLMAFLLRLTERLHKTCKLSMRLEGEPRDPAATLSRQQGACRDIAVLFVDACRSLGLASRFVSGYHYVPAETDSPEASTPQLHAWAEVYLPGGGWRGFDPSVGLATGEYHIALAAAAHAANAACLQGTYRGSDQGVTMTTAINITPATATATAT